MALEFVYNGKTHRAQIENLTINPQANFITATVRVFDLVNFDMRKVGLHVSGADYDTLDAITADAGDQVGRRLIAEGYNYLLSKPDIIEEIVTGGVGDPEFVAPVINQV